MMVVADDEFTVFRQPKSPPARPLSLHLSPLPYTSILFHQGPIRHQIRTIFCSFSLLQFISQSVQSMEGGQSPPAAGEVEIRIQVDRRRLEAMITGESSGEDATAFFTRVERITGARVCWPSRLKIRAKTKKDPFVKLIGNSRNVQNAAEMIELHLRIKKDRVSLKIEVSHSLHSQIIGRGGRNTQQIMRETGCHIHFPDSNKSAAANPPLAKNDQVSISGLAKDVERAREMVRAACPLTVLAKIQLGLGRNLYSLQSRLDPVQLQRQFPQNASGDLTVQFIAQSPPLLGTLHFLMRSSSRNELEMLRAFGRVCQLIGVFPSGAELHFESQFELRAAALPSLSVIRWIAFRTNTEIQLNQQGLLINGSLEGIFISRKLLSGLLPVSLHFEKPADLAGPSSAAFRLVETELDVQIGEKRRKKSSTKSAGTTTPSAAGDEKDFVVCTYEANLFGAYTARNRLLHIKEPAKDQFPQDSESAAFMRSMCRESLMADQQQPLVAAAASVAFSNSAAALSFEQKDALMEEWRRREQQREGDNSSNGKAVGAELAKCRQQERGPPKSPDPKESPIAAGLLAGAKSVNSQKGEFRKVLDREGMLLRANRAVYNTPTTEHGQDNTQRTPTDFWAGYGFSSSLPADLFRLRRMGSDEGGEGQQTHIWPRGRPIMGRGVGREEEDEQKDHSLGSNGLAAPPLSNARFGHFVADGPETTASIQTASVPLKSNFRYSQLVALHEEEEEDEGQSKSDQKASIEHGTSSRKGPLSVVAALKVHPRVAALQMGEQRRPKFAVSTGGLFDVFRTSTAINSTNGAQQFPSASLANRERAPEGTSTPPCPGGHQQVPLWDIRVLAEPALVLAQLGLAEHIAFFREQEIDMQAFLLLDEQCLKTLGVTTLGARRKIMHAIAKLRDSARRHGMYSL